MSQTRAPILRHNLVPGRFVWLWAKYVHGYNPAQHCTNSIRSPYSRRLSAHNRELERIRELTLDERPVGSYAAIYICGVAKQGYALKTNFPHNLHAAIVPDPGAKDRMVFEDWCLEVEHGRFLEIPPLESLMPPDSEKPEPFTSCRIFRWAVSFRPEGNRLSSYDGISSANPSSRQP